MVNKLFGRCHTNIPLDNPVLVALEEILLHGFLDTLKLVPFLFVTYLVMELIEHKAAKKAEHFVKRAGKLGPLVGGLVGAVPQCGFSAAASSFYAGRVISVGTLVAVFLSTSDEMLAILISEAVPVTTVLLILLYKAVAGAAVGFAVDIFARKLNSNQSAINIDAICDEDNCHCEKGVLHSAIHHTLNISLFLLAATVAINALVYFVGEQTLANGIKAVPLLGHVAAALFGLIPNCAASVVLATLCSDGLISAGTMISGLFSGAGVGLLVLFRTNKKYKENLLIMAILVAAGTLLGLLADVIFPNIVI